MHVLVTGASGFIGQHLLKQLKDSNHTTCAVTRRPGTKLFGANEYIFADLSIRDNLKKLETHFDAIVHLADGLSVLEKTKKSLSKKELSEYILPTLNLADWALTNNIKHFIYISSVKAMCSETETNILTETSKLLPNSAYGFAKKQTERELQARFKGQPTRLITLRNPIVHGPGSKNNLQKLLRLSDSPWPLPLKRLQNNRSTISVKNFSDAIKTVLDNPYKSGGTYLVADNGAISTTEIIEIFRQELGRSPRMFTIPRWLWLIANNFPGIKQITKRMSQPLVISDQQFRNIFEWEPLQTTQQSLKDMVQIYLEEEKQH